MNETKFHYKGNDYIIDECPTYPFSMGMLENSINSQFQDGYVTSRKRISRIFNTWILNFVAAKEENKLIIQELEYLVGQADIFTWFPTIPLDNNDYDDQGNIVIQPREVRLISPIQYDLAFFGHYDFTMNLQEAI